MRRLVCLVLMALIFLPRWANAASPEASLGWAERLLAHSSFEYQGSGGPAPQMQLRETEQAFSDILAKYGKSNGRAWAGLARAQARLGEYDKAADSYKQALAFLPGHEALRREAEEVRNQSLAAETALADLPKGETVLQALPYRAGSGQKLWAVLSARLVWDKEERYWPKISGSHLSIYRGNPDSLTKLWRSGILGSRGHTRGEFSDVYLYVKDVTGDGQPDLVLPKMFAGASWAPSHLDIFTWRAGRIEHLLGAVSDDPATMKDLNHDGRYEAMTDHAVGWDMSHAEQPRWLDIYAYKNGTYRQAEKDFPEQYKGLYREIRTVLRDHPGDFELLYYLGRVYEIQRKPCAALRAYRRAEKGAIKEAAEWRHDAVLSGGVSSELRDIRTRIRALSGRRVL